MGSSASGSAPLIAQGAALPARRGGHPTPWDEAAVLTGLPQNLLGCDLVRQTFRYFLSARQHKTLNAEKEGNC